MPVLDDTDRADLQAEFMRVMSLMGLVELLPNMVKQDIRDAVNAADVWANTNASAYNLALPLTFRTNATPSQKARLLMFVIARRWLRGV